MIYIILMCFLFLFFFLVFPTGLVRLYIAGLPLRSCQTIGAPSVQGSAQCLFFRFWLQQDSNPHPGAYHADVLPLRHFEPHIMFKDRQQEAEHHSAHLTLLSSYVLQRIIYYIPNESLDFCLSNHINEITITLIFQKV